MRLIDFYVFFITTLYKDKRRGNLLWDSPVRRTVFVVGLTLTLLLYPLLDIIVFLMARINIMESRLTEIGAIIGGVLLIQLLRYIYIVKKRYEFITSPQYKKFAFSTNVGVIICTMTSLISFLLTVGVGVSIHFFLKNHGGG